MAKWHNIFALIKQKHQDGLLPFFDFSSIDIKYINDYSNLIKSNFQTLLILGTGASILNAKAILSTISKPRFDIRFLDNLDPSTVNYTLNALTPEHTAILVISKSGSTNETLALLDYLTDNLVTSNNLFIITEDKESDLKTFSLQHNAAFINHSKDIGGRFAILTSVGLLPAAVAGIDIAQVIKSSQESLELILDKPRDIIEYVEWITQNITSERNCFIMMYYGDQLLGLHEWMRQIYAESLGKHNFGFTPIISRGTIDQHSQLQLYLDGPDDKFYSICFLNNAHQSIQHNKLNSLFELHAKSTYAALLECNRPTKYIEVNDLYQYISFTIIQTMLTIIAIAEEYEINPYDQPAVEIGKKYIKRSL